MSRIPGFALLAVLVLVPRCAAHADGAGMVLRSMAFEPGGAIPARHTCDDRDISPPLSWSGVPANAMSLALIVDDPDAPDPATPRTTWVHWILYNIPTSPSEHPDSLDLSGLPQGVRAGKNDFGRTSWGGPCPPVGKHRYFFKLYALDTRLYDLHEPTKAKLARIIHESTCSDRRSRPACFVALRPLGPHVGYSYAPASRPRAPCIQANLDGLATASHE